MDALEAVFVFCFVFGLATSVLSFSVGAFHGADGQLGGGHGHAGGDASHGAGHVGDGGNGADGVSPLNPQTITAFLTFFGGIGYLLYESAGSAPALALVGATVAGLVGAAIIFLFLSRVLLAGQRFVSPSSSRLDGTVARVSAAIRSDGTGEIVFDRDGTRRSEGARSATGEAIPIGAEVVIVRYERGLAFVEPWASYAGEP